VIAMVWFGKVAGVKVLLHASPQFGALIPQASTTSSRDPLPSPGQREMEFTVAVFSRNGKIVVVAGMRSTLCRKRFDVGRAWPGRASAAISPSTTLAH